MDLIPICESLDKGNEFETFLKRMVSGDEKSGEDMKQERSVPKSGKASETVAKWSEWFQKGARCLRAV